MLILSESGKQSSMRAAFFAVTLSVVMVLFSISGLIIASLFNSNELNWEGMATLAGAIAAPLASISGAKAFQKKYEAKDKGPEEFN